MPPPVSLHNTVRFAAPFSPYILEFLDLDQNANVKTASDPTTGECVMTITVTTTYLFDPTLTQKRTLTNTALLKAFFEPKGTIPGNGITISRINVYYDEVYLTHVFNEIFNTFEVREYVCETMRDYCPETWELNGQTSILQVRTN